MASTYSSLKIELIGTGDQSGTWGDTTNLNFSTAISEAITGTADVAFSSADVTLTLTDTNATQTARNLRLNLTGTSGGARNLILGSDCQIEKFYIINNGLADAVTVKNTTGTGITVPAGRTMFVFNNGTNVVDVLNYISGNIVSSSATITGGSINGTTIGVTTPSTGAFTTLSASSTVSGSGFDTYLGTPPAIGNATPNTGAFTSLSASGTLSGTAFSSYLAAPPSIGSGTPASGAFTTLSTTGSLTMIGTSNRFTADFSNTTVTNRMNFATSTTNGTTGIYALPNGTGTAAAWQAASTSDPTNTSKILIATNGSTDVQLVSGINGTGTYLPLSIYNSGDVRFQVGTAGELGVRVSTGVVSYGTSGQVLTSSGTGASPTWSSGSSMTLLGTLTTTSGTTAVLSGLILTGYKQLEIIINNVSFTGTGTLTLNGVVLGTAAAATQSYWGQIVVDLNVGSFASNIGIGTSTTGTISNTTFGGATGNTGITSSSTVLTFAGGTFDAGTIYVYGDK